MATHWSFPKGFPTTGAFPPPFFPPGFNPEQLSNAVQTSSASSVTHSSRPHSSSGSKSQSILAVPLSSNSLSLVFTSSSTPSSSPTATIPAGSVSRGGLSARTITAIAVISVISPLIIVGLVLLLWRRSRRPNGRNDGGVETAAHPFESEPSSRSPSRRKDDVGVCIEEKRSPETTARDQQELGHRVPSPSADQDAVLQADGDSTSARLQEILLARVANLEALVIAERNGEAPPPRYSSESPRHSMV
ncbi:hypothetical protein HGRIS_007237 [Hohenbuehelia grisea]|uniref:Uncharacterized protein n=1 Tax=Hohenbuehelia grisea TaxID=104357 RepID=A0ABR3JD53_9AGAR